MTGHELLHLLGRAGEQRHVITLEHMRDFFLDFSPLDLMPGQELNDLMEAFILPVHLFAKLVKTNDDLTLVALDVEWLNERLKANPKEIAHVLQGNDVPLLTGSTEEVKKFLTRHASDTNAFKSAIILTAKKSAK